MYKFKLKEIEIGDTAIRRGKKSTVSAIDDKTGRIEWDIVDAADFSSVYKALSKANDFLSTLEREGKAKDDVVIDGFAKDIANLFNAFRTHVRKNYPKEYERVSRLKEEEIDETSLSDKLIEPFDKAIKSGKLGLEKNKELLDKITQLTKSLKEGHGLSPTDLDYLEGLANRTENVILKKIVNKLRGQVEEGEGIGYLTPNAFGKKKNNVYTSQYGYKLVPKKIKGSGIIVKQLFEKDELKEYSNFQQKRINVFGEIEDRINNILPMLSNAKNETAEYYNENPGSYAIVVPTDYILEILDEVELKLKQVQDK
jgi:hypothetical protein